jgi:hypothetical protein
MEVSEDTSYRSVANMAYVAGSPASTSQAAAERNSLLLFCPYFCKQLLKKFLTCTESKFPLSVQKSMHMKHLHLVGKKTPRLTKNRNTETRNVERRMEGWNKRITRTDRKEKEKTKKQG